MLVGKHLSLQIGTVEILRDISVELQPATITALVGPNGAGKSSLLKLLSGEWTPNSGQILIDDQPLQSIHNHELARRRACLPQESTLDFAFSVMEVVLLGRSPHIKGSERKEDLEIAREALARVDMEACCDRIYTQLSGGEKKRVQLARVLAQIFPVDETERYLFLDEPMNSLDLAHQIDLVDLLSHLRCHNTAVCIVLHDLNQAMQFADHVILLKSGCLMAADSPANLINQPLLDEAFGIPLKRQRIEGNPLPWLSPAPRE